MHDATAKTSIHTSEAAQKRLKKRYAFEARFQILGALAIVFAALALFTLLSTVVGKAFGALTETYITLNINFAKDKIDPQNTGDKDVIFRANYAGLWKDAIKKKFPEVTGRREKLKLYKMISDGATLQMRKDVVEDNSLIGQTKPVKLLADDDVDLYFKGDSGSLKQVKSYGTATPNATEGEVKVFLESNTFKEVLLLIKQSLNKEARRLRLNAQAQQRGVDFYAKQLATAKNDEERQNIQNQIKGYELRRDKFLEQVKDFEDRAKAPGGTENLTEDLPSFFIRIHSGVIKVKTVSTDYVVGEAFLPLLSTKTAQAGQWELLVNKVPESSRKVSDKKVVWLDKLDADGLVTHTFNWRFFTAGSSRNPEKAGVWGAVVGSFFTMIVTLILAFPIGVLAAIYLEEFAPKNILTSFIEVNINNLAAVPSIVFGLLGLYLLQQFLPDLRSAALIGGIVLALMSLPTIIIASRAAIKAVPPSIREAALGIGASKNQAVFHHVLPLAMPGILTGTIIAMAQALGETAPLLMIGMVAFIQDIPTSIFDPATVLPVQVYQWADFPERAFEMRTAMAIIVLLSFLVVMNAIAIFLRQKFERRW